MLILIWQVLILARAKALARGLNALSSLLYMLTEIFRDMMPFLSVMTFAIVTNTFAFIFIEAGMAASSAHDSDSAGYESLEVGLFSAYALTLGDFEQDTYKASTLMSIFFLWFTFGVNVVLLNVLIAIISDAFERLQEKAKEVGCKNDHAICNGRFAFSCSRVWQAAARKGEGGFVI